MSRKRGTPNDPTARRALNAEGTTILRKLLDTFSPRERDIVAMRFGLDDGRPMTLSEIGRAHGVTGERIRDIETAVISKLGHPSRRTSLAVNDGEAVVGFVDARLTAADISSLFSDKRIVRCAQCQERRFVPDTGGRKRIYCSNACRQAAYRARRSAMS